MSNQDGPTALVVGASRGLGFGMVRELAGRGWSVVGTVRQERDGEPLRALGPRVSVAMADVVDVTSLDALKADLEGRLFDLLFVNAGVARGQEDVVTTVGTEAFANIMLTNTLGPLRVIERFQGAVRRDGVVGVMSSGLGSVGGNTSGGWEVYRASKAALNTLLRSFAARHPDAPWGLVAVAPGWVRTDMGGPEAGLDVETSMRGVVDVLEGRRGRRGLAYLDYKGETVTW